MQPCSLTQKAKVNASFVEKSSKAAAIRNLKLRFYSGDAFQNSYETITFLFLIKEALIELLLG